MTLASIAVFQKAWLYTIHSLVAPVRHFGKLGLGLTAVFAGVMALAFALDAGQAIPRGWLLAWLAACLGALALGRAVHARLAARWTRQGRLARRAVIVGGGRDAEDLIRSLERSGSNGIRILGIFDDRGDGRSPETLAGYHKLGDFRELVAFCRDTRVDLLVVTLPASAEKRLLQVLKKLWVLPVDIRLSAHSSRLRLRPRSYSYIGDVPFLPLFDRPLTDWGTAIKAIEDRALGWLLGLLAAPVMALVALAVRLDSRGPVLFKQKRHGFNNELIEVYKFRSMYVDQADRDAAKLVTRDDPRVTRVGRFIRKTSLDELPQLFNVLTGGLSLVGPRPHATQAKAANALYDEVVDGYFARHRVKPGITGWAQINGWRGETDTPEKIQRRVEHDLYYIENWSVLFDLYIVVMTPFALLKAQNAY